MTSVFRILISVKAVPGVTSGSLPACDPSSAGLTHQGLVLALLFHTTEVDVRLARTVARDPISILWLLRRTSRIVGLFKICLPQVRAEHFVLDVPGRNTKLN